MRTLTKALTFVQAIAFILIGILLIPETWNSYNLTEPPLWLNVLIALAPFVYACIGVLVLLKGAEIAAEIRTLPLVLVSILLIALLGVSVLELSSFNSIGDALDDAGMYAVVRIGALGTFFFAGIIFVLGLAVNEMLERRRVRLADVYVEEDSLKGV